jgi:predicted nuclease of predicted toxin-antitoxin system
MKLLFDQNISFRAVRDLAKVYPGSKHLSDCGLMNSRDLDIWNWAQQYGYTIVTFDADFYDISIIHGHPPKIIWLRTGNLTKRAIVDLLTEKEAQVREFIQSEALNEVSCLEIG